MQQKDWLSAEEVAKEIKVSAMTIKRNCQTYSNFLKFQQGEKNKYLIHQECIPVFQFITKMRNKRNLQTKQIIELLSKEGFPKYIDIEPIQTTKQQPEQIQVEQGIVAIQELDRIVAERVSEQLKKHEENLKKWLTEQQKQQQDFQKAVIQRMDERDQNLMTMIRETQETKKLIAATQQKKWWQFWK
ncbi:DNA-binding protein [Bacillus cereus]|nr:DNA-binding protein [Bacillus cereus]PGP79141.1 DNA-binding protein [Bacillus cereus]